MLAATLGRLCGMEQCCLHFVTHTPGMGWEPVWLVWTNDGAKLKLIEARRRIYIVIAITDGKTFFFFYYACM